MRILDLSLALALVMAAAPSRADSPKVEPMPAPASVHAFGADHPACAEWTDGCVTCARGDSSVNCSTPGIACQPSEIQCRKPMK